MKTTHQTPVYPQTVEIPEPLEVHPSVDPELARGLLAAVEYIEDHPQNFSMRMPYLSGERGCIICHVERLSNWRRGYDELPQANNGEVPLGHFSRIFWPRHWEALGYTNQSYYQTGPRIARINHFLSTGQ